LTATLLISLKVVAISNTWTKQRWPTPEQRKAFAPYRSGLEKITATDLGSRKVKFKYETLKLKYTQPAKNRTYTPDFVLPNGIILEVKGEFDSDDRNKHLLIKEQHPHLDIRFVFGNPNQRINPGSPTTYAMWCGQHGFLWCHRRVPSEWLKDKQCQTLQKK
jgi:hypothetical protein